MSRPRRCGSATTLCRSRSASGLSIYSKRSEEEDAGESGGESPLRVYRYGERLHFTAKLRTPRNYRNPGALDLAGYLASQGIRLTGSAHASDVEILPGFVGSRFECGAAPRGAACWSTSTSCGRASAAR